MHIPPWACVLLLQTNPALCYKKCPFTVCGRYGEYWRYLSLHQRPLFTTHSLPRQVVRDQCWLNEILLGCQWSVATLEETEPVGGEATEEELEAALSGIHYPIFTVS